MTENRNVKTNVKQLVNEIRRLNLRLSDHEAKIDLINKFMTANFSYLGDIETKIESFKTTLIRKNVTTEAEFDELWDEIKGVRLKGEDETIAPGDFCRVTFQGRSKQDGRVLLEEKNLPIRLGSGTLFVDDHLVGKKVGQGKFEFDYEYPKDYESPLDLGGKTLAFELSIDKVKTRINEGKIVHA